MLARACGSTSTWWPSNDQAWAFACRPGSLWAGRTPSECIQYRAVHDLNLPGAAMIFTCVRLACGLGSHSRDVTGVWAQFLPRCTFGCAKTVKIQDWLPLPYEPTIKR
jgi:hypothetical protein